MKLTSMTDFVLNQFIIWKDDNNPDCQSSARYILGTNAYAIFLKKQLKLEMFVPCDENDNPLEEPIFDGDHDLLEYKHQEFEQAKDKVLFEGFKIRKHLNFTYISKEGYEIDIRCLSSMKIEDLVDNDIELTVNAIKQI